MDIRSINKNDLTKLRSHEVDGIRQLRKPLLKAFDVYKTNVVYGIEKETDVERAEIIAWYNKLLDKDKTALEIIPQKIQRYL